MEERGRVEKPASVAQDPFKSAKWDELTAGRSFEDRHIPTLTLLVQWHAVVQRCIEDMDALDGQVAYQNDMGDLRALPQIATMKQASAEIRQLNKQLGIDDVASDGGGAKNGSNVLRLVTERREKRVAASSS